MKYTNYKGTYYTYEKDKTGTLLLTPAYGLDKIKAWAREYLKDVNELRSPLWKIRFIQIDNKIIALSSRSELNGRAWGMAVCNTAHEDFDLEVGKAIAVARLLGDSSYIPDFVINGEDD